MPITASGSWLLVVFVLIWFVGNHLFEISDVSRTGSVLLAALTVFVLAILCGFAVISKVPATLHTPLMSGANAIHGVIVVGVMLVAARTESALGHVVLFVAAAFAAMNVVGGYVVTDRMLDMFRARPHDRRRP